MDEFVVKFTKEELALLGTDKASQQKQIEAIIRHQLKEARKKFNKSLLGTENE